MVAQLLLDLLADVVLNKAMALRKSFDQEMTRYLDERGFPPEATSKRASAS